MDEIETLLRVKVRRWPDLTDLSLAQDRMEDQESIDKDADIQPQGVDLTGFLDEDELHDSITTLELESNINPKENPGAKSSCVPYILKDGRDMQYPINNQSIKYLRLKNARRCIICHTPSESSATIVNQAKFCTRTFVDTKRGPRRSVVGGACDRKRLYCSCFEIAPLCF